MTRYDINNGDYEKTASYVVGTNGEVWGCCIGEPARFSSIDRGTLELMTPFIPGDIITVDMRPYHRPFHAVVCWNGYANPMREDSCTPFVIYIDAEENDKLDSRALKHMDIGFDAFSPLLRAEKYEGRLPESEKIIADISKYIKTHENGAEDIEAALDKSCSGSSIFGLLYGDK